MIDIEDQECFGKSGPKLLQDAGFPTIRKILLGIEIFREESALVWHTYEDQHRRNHIQMRHQYRLRQIAGEILIVLANPPPEPRHRLPQKFRIDLVQMRAHLKTFIDLVGFELSD